MYLLHMGRAKQAYDAHKGPKVLVKYEDLRADTLEAARIGSLLFTFTDSPDRSN